MRRRGRCLLRQRRWRGLRGGARQPEGGRSSCLVRRHQRLQRRRACARTAEPHQPRREVRPDGGFIVTNYLAKFPEASAFLAKALTDGTVKGRVQTVDGLARAPEALNMLFPAATPGNCW